MPFATLAPFIPPVSLSPVRVAPGGRYFETIDGDPFLFIGFNDAIDWPGLGGLFNRRDYAAAEKYLEKVAASGVTVLRLMLEYTHHEHRYFEKLVGQFPRAMVRLWDDLFTLCARFGLRVLLTPFDTFWMARRWHRHPYNRNNGGPAETPQSLLTDNVTIDAVIARLRFVIERWGGTGVIVAWDLWNEIHPHWGGSPQEQAQVLERIGAAVREHERHCHGFSRPQSVSIFGPEPGLYTDLIFRGSGLDFATTHIYQGAIDFPKDTVQPALLMGSWVRHALRETPSNRPFTDSEHGPIHLFNDHHKYLPEPFDDEYERRLMWVHLASGGAGSGMRWPARHPHLVTEGMLAALCSLSRFTRECGLDWRCFQPQDANDLVTVTLEDKREVVHRFAVADDRCVLLYLLRAVPPKHEGVAPTRSTLSNVRVTVSDRQPGQYRVTIWNTTQGAVQQMCRITVNEGREPAPMTLVLPSLNEEIAITVTRV